MSVDNIMVGGIRTTRISRTALAERMLEDCLESRSGNLPRPKIVFSSNGSVIARYHSDMNFRELINKADIVDADGAPLVFASRMFCKHPIVERVATTDLIHDCCAVAARRELRFYFLGGGPGVAEEAASRLQLRHQGLQIVGTRDGYFKEEDEAAICDEIVAAGTDVLWVGMGSPLQEQFAIDHRDQLSGLGWIRTCGGLFDHIAGRVPRAPLWMQQYGLEWLHRLLQEPARLGPRYLKTNPVAAYHLLTKTYEVEGTA